MHLNVLHESNRAKLSKWHIKASFDNNKNYLVTTLNLHIIATIWKASSLGIFLNHNSSPIK